MEKVRVFLDLDGVIADLTKAVFDFHNIEDPFVNSENLGNYYLHEMIDMTAAEIWGPLGEDFWECVPLTEEAHKILEIIHEFVPEERVCFLTAPTFHPGSASGKMKWIRNHFPKFWSERRFLIGPAKYFCSGHNSLLIDDHDNNCDKFIEAGGAAFLYPRVWNRHHMYQSAWGLLMLREYMADFVKDKIF